MKQVFPEILVEKFEFIHKLSKHYFIKIIGQDMYFQIL